MAKKIGDGHAMEMFKRGLAEIREVGHFSGGNIAQPNHHYPTFYGNREAVPDAGQPEQAAAPEQGHAAEHER